MTFLLEAHALDVDIAGRRLLSGIDLRVGRGELLAVVGINGCGKSTLLDVLAGQSRPVGGAVRVDVDDALVSLAALRRRAIARRIAIMRQSLPPLPGLSVELLLQQAQYPWRGPLGMLAPSDPSRIEQALAAVEASGWEHRQVDRLSGGERQRIRLALALAQQAPVLLLDEPTAHLDLHHQFTLLRLVRELARSQGLAVVVVLHDLDHAALFADRILVLHDGGVWGQGPAAEIVNERMLSEVFQVSGRIVHDPLDRRRIVVDAAEQRDTRLRLEAR